jgi:hypothetical protein
MMDSVTHVLKELQYSGLNLSFVRVTDDVFSVRR